MSQADSSIAVVALDVPPRTKPSNYPEPFAARMAGREKRALGDFFGLANFGVNLTRLVPGAGSAIRHAHATQDEFIYILEGYPVLITDHGETPLAPGMCSGFKAGTGNAHHLVNRTDADVLYLDIGDRSPSDSVSYPDDDLQAVFGDDGTWQFAHKDGTRY
ncbi:cupin domain-containing protein [Undibacterium sp. 14-3-2]|uniref:cupin domain-containing protein n=1 Tax=Undibacterium sp. 14-3-2 TaxID=2800129 RepID=UPI001905ACEB|nr:cupin domain-containing protein [Undibacterium sp. 14-3-2]MBK1890342.1 cupin domain-containing protein [Undibacterium sp. 14-3-2]